MSLLLIQKQHTLTIWNIFILFIAITLGSCNALGPTLTERSVFKMLDSVDYPFQKIVNEDISKSLKEFLTDEDISKLDNWSDTAPFLENFLKTECAGCSNAIANFKPIYRLKKGRFIHFGLRSEMGVENWIFKKNGAFVTRFYLFQGESQEQIVEVLKDGKRRDYILEGVYPTAIEPKSIYLEHMEYHNNTVAENTWYHPIYPTKIKYRIDLAKKQSTLRFKIDGGLYSHQTTTKNGKFQIINFVEPLIYPNAVGINEPMSYSSFTDAFYANATFFLLKLEEGSEVSIHIESKIAGKEFKFSVLQNDRFHTMDEYLQKEGALVDRYQSEMGEGKYLIRVIHTNTNYSETPLYTLKVDYKNLRENVEKK